MPLNYSVILRFFHLHVLCVGDRKQNSTAKNRQQHQQTMARAARQRCPGGTAALKHHPAHKQEADGWRMGGWPVARGGHELGIRYSYIKRLKHGEDQRRKKLGRATTPPIRI